MTRGVINDQTPIWSACHDSRKLEMVEVEEVVAHIVFGPSMRTWVGVRLPVRDAYLGWSFHWKGR